MGYMNETTEKTPADFVTLKVSNGFFDHHVDRGIICSRSCDDEGMNEYEWEVKRTKTYSIIRLRVMDVYELIDDARFYASEYDPAFRAVRGQAKRLIESVTNQLTELGYEIEKPRGLSWLA